MNHLKIINSIGSGSYGTVYKCYNKEKNHFVAVKSVYHNDPSKKNWNLDSTTIREIMTYCKLKRHINIIQFFSLKINQYTTSFELELSPGITLYTFLKKQQKYSIVQNAKQSQNISEQIIDAVQHLHDCGIAHRDLAPRNIHVIEDEHKLGRMMIKIYDFGLAICENDMLGPTYCTTRWYRPPELLVIGHPLAKTVDEINPYSVDWWSVGCLIVETYSYHPIFPGNDYQQMIYYYTTYLGFPTDTNLYTIFLKTQCAFSQQVIPSCGVYTDIVSNIFLNYDPRKRFYNKYKKWTLYETDIIQTFTNNIMSICPRIPKDNIDLFVDKVFNNTCYQNTHEQNILRLLLEHNFFDSYWVKKEDKKKRCCCLCHNDTSSSGDVDSDLKRLKVDTTVCV